MGGTLWREARVELHVGVKFDRCASEEELDRPSGTDPSAPTPSRPPRPRRRIKPKPKERLRYPEGLLLKHARLLIERGYPLEDVAETIGSRPDDLRRVLEVGHRD